MAKSRPCPCLAIGAAPNIILWGGLLVTDATFISTEDQQLAAPAAQHCMAVPRSKGNFHQALPFSAFPVTTRRKKVLPAAPSDDGDASIGRSQNSTKMGKKQR